MEERITETTSTDTAGQPHITTVERRSGGGGGLLIGIVLLVAVIIGAFFLLNQSRNDNAQTEVITGAADAVSDGAAKVGDAAESAVSGGE